MTDTAVEHDLAFWRGMTWVVVAYATALVGAMLATEIVPSDDPLLLAFVADVVATIVIFGFSGAFLNASFYDAYWSVAPIAIVGYWTMFTPADGHPVRQALLLGVVAFWGTRLTTNWAIGWTGLHHEDWRYVDLRRKTGLAFPVVNFLGIHLMPTLLVFAGLWPVWRAVSTPAPLSVIDVAATVLAVGATVIEATADGQLRTFRAHRTSDEAVIDEGLWRWSRHPNYLGEITFWWALWLYAVAIGPQHAITCVGAFAIALLFRFISIPLMERRMLDRRPLYGEVVRAVPMLLPWPPRHDPIVPPEPDVDDAVEALAEPDPIEDEAARLGLDTQPYIAPPDDPPA